MFGFLFVYELKYFIINKQKMIETNNFVVVDLKKESNHMEEIKEDMSKTETSKKATGVRQACYDCITCLLCANLCIALVENISALASLC
jgi:succinate dehydrogenase/fumarate reductase-like Fe-S protein